jgi:hypothetical protein
VSQFQKLSPFPFNNPCKSTTNLSQTFPSNSALLEYFPTKKSFASFPDSHPNLQQNFPKLKLSLKFRYTFRQFPKPLRPFQLQKGDVMIMPWVDHIISKNTSDACTRNPLTPITIHALPLDTGKRRRVELSNMQGNWSSASCTFSWR